MGNPFTRYTVGYKDGRVIEKVSDSLLTIVMGDGQREDITFVIESEFLEIIQNNKENENE